MAGLEAEQEQVFQGAEELYNSAYMAELDNTLYWDNNSADSFADNLADNFGYSKGADNKFV